MIKEFIKSFAIKDQTTKEVDVILSLVVFAVVIAGLKFLFDGVTIHAFGHIISFGHTDSLSYGSMLSPILGAHGYIRGKSSGDYTQDNISKVDNPDEGEM